MAHFLNAANAHSSLVLFDFNEPAATVIYTLSLHDALPIWLRAGAQLVSPARLLDGKACAAAVRADVAAEVARLRRLGCADRKSTRLNSSHMSISYAVFCLKKKKNVPTHGTVRLALLPDDAV